MHKKNLGNIGSEARTFPVLSWVLGLNVACWPQCMFTVCARYATDVHYSVFLSVFALHWIGLDWIGWIVLDLQYKVFKRGPSRGTGHYASSGSKGGEIPSQSYGFSEILKYTVLMLGSPQFSAVLLNSVMAFVIADWR